jgi:hypothetical protein
VRYEVTGDRPLVIVHCSGGRQAEVRLRPGVPVTRTWRPVRPRTRRPQQPPGREPLAIGRLD